MMNPQDDPRYGTPATGPGTGFHLDRKALTVAGLAMGITLALWLLHRALNSVFGGAGLIIMLLVLAGGGGYVVYRRRNPQQAGVLEARVQQLTRNAAGRVSAAAHAPTAPPLASSVGGGPVYPSPQPSVPFPGMGAPPQAEQTAALVSAVLLIPSLIAYAWRYESTSFTDPWQPWWILTGLNLYFVFCVAVRARTPGRAPLAVLLGLAGTGLIALANNPSRGVNLMTIFSTKRYSQGISYSVPPSPEVMLWISRVPILAVLIFVAAWGIARRRQPGWVLGLIPTGLLVWWSIYGAQHGFGWRGGWFQFWLMSVGVFVGGCVCCWLADLLTSGGGVSTAMPSYAPPVWTGLPGPPHASPGPPAGGQPPAHADYREQAARHFPGAPQNLTGYPGQTYRPPGDQGGSR